MRAKDKMARHLLLSQSNDAETIRTSQRNLEEFDRFSERMMAFADVPLEILENGSLEAVALAWELMEMIQYHLTPRHTCFRAGWWVTGSPHNSNVA